MVIYCILWVSHHKLEYIHIRIFSIKFADWINSSRLLSPVKIQYTFFVGGSCLNIYPHHQEQTDSISSRLFSSPFWYFGTF